MDEELSFSTKCPCCEQTIEIKESDTKCTECSFEGLFIDETIDGTKFVDYNQSDVEFYMYVIRKKYATRVK